MAFGVFFMRVTKILYGTNTGLDLDSCMFQMYFVVARN